MIAVAFAMFAVRSAETGSVADGPIGMTSRLKHQRDRYDAMMRLGPNGLPPLALTKALQQAAAMLGPTSPTTWTFLGPNWTLKGQTLTDTCDGSNNPIFGVSTVSGRVTAIGFGSGSSTYVGTAHGGV